MLERYSHICVHAKQAAIATLEQTHAKMEARLAGATPGRQDTVTDGL